MKNHPFSRPLAPVAATVAGGLLALSLLACPAGAITLDADFDHGSLQSWSEQTAGRLTTLNLVGRDNFYGNGRWRWLHFRADDVQNKQPVFSISDNFAGGGNALNHQSMVYSYDGDNWNYFDNNNRSGGNFRFSNSSPFTQSQVHVAYAFPYSYGKSQDHTAQILATPWATPTGSGGPGGVIGFSPGGTDDLGRTVDPRPIYAYRITNPATDGAATKRKAVFTTGMHAGETLGTHTFQGLTDWLVSNDPRAASLRDVAEFYNYPTLNPDGRFAGNSRATVENPNQDPNGRWHPTNWAGHEDIQVNGEAMLADVQQTPGSLDAFIDFHSTIPASPGDDFAFIEHEQNDDQAPFWLNLKQLQPNVLDVDSTGTNWTSANFADILLGAEVDITFETQFGFDRPLSYYHQLGKNFGLAFYQAWAPAVAALPGDANWDGFVAQGDLDTVLQNWGDAATTLEQGDLNANGQVEQGDLDLVLQNWGSTAAPDFEGSTVPEPTAAVVLLSAAALLPRRRAC